MLRKLSLRTCTAIVLLMVIAVESVAIYFNIVSGDGQQANPEMSQPGTVRMGSSVTNAAVCPTETGYPADSPFTRRDCYVVNAGLGSDVEVIYTFKPGKVKPEAYTAAQTQQNGMIATLKAWLTGYRLGKNDTRSLTLRLNRADFRHAASFDEAVLGWLQPYLYIS